MKSAATPCASTCCSARTTRVLDFDLAKVIEASRDNPVFYVQYGHARGQSVFRNAREVLPDLPEEAAERVACLAKAPLERLTEPARTRRSCGAWRFIRAPSKRPRARP